MRRYIYNILGGVLLILFAYSCKQVKLSDADKKFAEGEYFTAADMYRKIYRKLPAKERDIRGKVAYRMGESYRLINNPLRANSAYVNAIRYKLADSTLHLQYARTLHKAGNYKEATKQYQEFLKLFPDNQFGLNGLKGIQQATEWRNNPTDYEVKRSEVLNSRWGEFAPALLPPDYDQIYFASNRKGTVSDTLSGVTGARLYDIFMSRKDEKGEWMKPERIESPINTVGDEGAMSFLPSGSVMYYTGCPLDTLGAAFVNIYVSNRSGGAWGSGSKLEINKRDSLSVFAHPSISPSGDYLYFVSNTGRGRGGKDIWRARLVGELVEYVENLGPDINTAGDEMFPYVRNDSTLYFASDGHAGMGGLDLYKAVYRSGANRWFVENLKYPINSSSDDFGITFEGDKERGYFSSNRNDGKGMDHIYSFVLPVTTTRLEGYIVDTDDEFVEKASIRMVGRDGTNVRLSGRDNGTYSYDLEKGGTEYVFLANAEGYLNTKMSLKTVATEKDSIYYVDFVLTPINKPVVLENIFFDFDKSTLRPESKEELDGLVELLKLNPNVSIELSAHTDRKGRDEYNDRLSQRRAEAVVSFLISHGIEEGRLVAVGKGKKEPKTVTKGIVKKYDFLKEGDVLTEEYIEQLTPEQQEMADQVNRRTEFKVLSVTYNLQ